MAQIGMQVSTLNGAVAFGATSMVLTAVTNLKPGMVIVVGDGAPQDWVQVAGTYTGGTTVPIDGTFSYPHASGVHAQWDGNAEPGLTGS
jgi:hypothetical protein